MLFANIQESTLNNLKLPIRFKHLGPIARPHDYESLLGTLTNRESVKLLTVVPITAGAVPTPTGVDLARPSPMIRRPTWVPATLPT